MWLWARLLADEVNGLLDDLARSIPAEVADGIGCQSFLREDVQRRMKAVQ